MTMNVAVIGSCLSNLTAIKLVQDYQFKRICNVAHNRSDCFINSFLDKKKEQVSLHELENTFVFKADKHEIGWQILKNQYRPYLGQHELPNVKPFLDIEEGGIDLFILDNFMDVAARLVRFKNKSEYFPFFINQDFLEQGDAELEIVDFLDVESSVANWKQIVDSLKILHPRARFVFLSFQYATLVNKQDRFDRSRAFSKIMSDYFSNTDIMFIPSLITEPELTMGVEDWAHFNQAIYKALAGVIFLNVTTRSEIPVKSIFNQFDFVEIENYQNALQNLCQGGECAK